MYPVSQAYRTAIDSQNTQHIRGSITTLSGDVLDITDLIVDADCESRCMSDSNQFGIGGMYVGALNCELNVPYSMKDELIDAEIVVESGVTLASGEIEWIPMGRWYVSSGTRSTGDRLKLTCNDTLIKLLVDTKPHEKAFVGVVDVKRIMAHVTDLTGVEFAQTYDEINDMYMYDLYSFGFAAHYGNTAWEEVQGIAKLLGCFAFANREGKIEFRKLASEPVLSITADRRHKAQFGENSYRIRSLSYLDSYGHKSTLDIADDGADITFSDNYIIKDWDTVNDPDKQYEAYLKGIAANVKDVQFTPGTMDCYSDPALDVGDYVTISDGILFESAPFLICSNVWRFRGAQTLTCSGVSETGMQGASSSSSKEETAIRNVNLTKTIKYIMADSSVGELLDTPRTAAVIDCACKSQTAAFLDFSATICGGTATMSVTADGNQQPYTPMISADYESYGHIHFTMPMMLDGGNHRIEVKGFGSGRLDPIYCYIWGQDLREISTSPTEESDYRYYINNGKAVIIGYLGEVVNPEIPSKLGGAPVTVIEATAFNYADVTNVYIPEGVTEIR